MKARQFSDSSKGESISNKYAAAANAPEIVINHRRRLSIARIATSSVAHHAMEKAMKIPTAMCIHTATS
jgi:hypothetical protein